MRSSSKSKLKIFFSNEKKKAQFFILTGFAIVSMLYFISRWTEPYTIIDTSSVVLYEEPFIFDNIADKARQVIYNTAENPNELKYNLEEYKAFVENYGLRKNINITLDINPSHLTFGDPTTGYINISLLSPTVTMSKRITVDRSFALVGWWKFDEGKGSTASDSSGDRNHGTVSGASWVDGKYGKALNFDGSNDYVEISYAGFPMMTSITAEFWIKSDTVNVMKSCFSRYGSAGQQFGFFWLGTNKIAWYINGGGDTNFVLADQVLEKGVWYHVVGVFNGATKNQEIFINGVSKGKRTYSVTLNNPSANIVVGNDAFYLSRYFDGVIDEVRIWNVALSPEQIRAHFLER